jgi:hypothetical protein
MTPERWATIEALFHVARALPPERRHAFVREQCGGDDGLYQDVVSLLGQATDGTDLLSVTRDVAFASVTSPPSRIGG